MKRSGYARRILAAVLTLTLLLGLALPAGAVGKSDVIHPPLSRWKAVKQTPSSPAKLPRNWKNHNTKIRIKSVSPLS